LDQIPRDDLDNEDISVVEGTFSSPPVVIPVQTDNIPFVTNPAGGEIIATTFRRTQLPNGGFTISRAPLDSGEEIAPTQTEETTRTRKFPPGTFINIDPQGLRPTSAVRDIVPTASTLESLLLDPQPQPSAGLLRSLAQWCPLRAQLSQRRRSLIRKK
jgi:hypothetical protein